MSTLDGHLGRQILKVAHMDPILFSLYCASGSMLSYARFCHSTVHPKQNLILSRAVAL